MGFICCLVGFVCSIFYGRIFGKERRTIFLEGGGGYSCLMGIFDWYILSWLVPLKVPFFTMVLMLYWSFSA